MSTMAPFASNDKIQEETMMHCNDESLTEDIP